MKGKTKDSKKINEYNAKGAPETAEATEEKEAFKKGGKIKKYKMGGHVKGEEAKHHLGKAKRASGGRSPFSSAAKVSTEASDNGSGKGTTPMLEQKVYKKGGKVDGLSEFHSNKASKHHGG